RCDQACLRGRGESCRGGECADGRHAAGRTSLAAALEHSADRSGPGTGKARASLLPLCRRLQYLCRMQAERRAVDDGDHGVSRAKTETESQCGQERGGPSVAAEVSGLQHDVAPEAEAEDRASESRKICGENAPDVAPRTRTKFETNHRATQPRLTRLGCILPAHRSERCVGRTRW